MGQKAAGRCKDRGGGGVGVGRSASEFTFTEFCHDNVRLFFVKAFFVCLFCFD